MLAGFSTLRRVRSETCPEDPHLQALCKKGTLPLTNLCWRSDLRMGIPESEFTANRVDATILRQHGKLDPSVLGSGPNYAGVIDPSVSRSVPDGRGVATPRCLCRKRRVGGQRCEWDGFRMLPGPSDFRSVGQEKSDKPSWQR